MGGHWPGGGGGGEAVATPAPNPMTLQPSPKHNSAVPTTLRRRVFEYNMTPFCEIGCPTTTIFSQPVTELLPVMARLWILLCS